MTSVKPIGQCCNIVCILLSLFVCVIYLKFQQSKCRLLQTEYSKCRFSNDRNTKLTVFPLIGAAELGRHLSSQLSSLSRHQSSGLSQILGTHVDILIQNNTLRMLLPFPTKRFDFHRISSLRSKFIYLHVIGFLLYVEKLYQ